MISKTSFFKSLKEDARHRIWVPALSCVVFLLGLIAATLMLQSIAVSQSSFTESYMLARAAEQAQGLFNRDNPLLTIIAITGAVICAIQGFSYLFSRKQLDFYHALPIRRQQLFMIRWFNGVLFYVIPAIVFSVLSLVLLLAFGMFTGTTAWGVAVGFLHNLLVFLLVYHCGIFFAMLTGNLLVTLGLYGFFSIYAFIIVKLIPTFMSVYYTTYAYFSYGISEYISYLAPAYLIVQLQTTSSVGMYVYALGFSIVFLAAALFVYLRRPSESAGKAIAFAKLKPVFRILIVIPLSIYIGLAFGQLASGSRGFWSLFGLLFFAILIHAVLNVIFAFDIHAAFTHRRELVFSAAAATVFMSIFITDVLKLDEQIPSMHSVEAVYVDLPVDNDIPYLDLSNGYSLGVTNYRESHAMLTGSDLSKIYDLLDCRNTTATDAYSSSDFSTVNLNVRFVKNNGHSEYRNFQFDLTDNSLSAMAAVFDTKSYKQGHYQIFDSACGNAFDTFNALDVCGNVIVRSTTGTNIFTKAETKELLDLLRSDLGSFTFEQMNSEIPLGTVSLQNSTRLYSLEYRIFPSFTKTLAWLTAHGIDFNVWKEYTPVSMTVYLNDSSDMATDSDAELYGDETTAATSPSVQDEYTITDPDTIRSIYPYLYSENMTAPNAINYASNMLSYNTVIITFTDTRTGETTSTSFSLTSDCDIDEFLPKKAQ